MLLAIARQNEPRYRLTAEQIEEVRLAVIEVDRGEFASEEEMAAVWKKYGV